MSTTQQHLSIKDVSDDILLLKSGGGALVLQVSAVNFGLLSDREQIAIIYSFAQMLNSLSFSIQIVIHSERLNINSYLELLDKAQKLQTNQLLSQMINQYKQFVTATIKENEVLDKKFYIVIPLFSLELGLTSSKENLKQKIKTVLLPRRDQIIRQLNRVGLNATQLSGEQLIRLFFDIYNGEAAQKPAIPEVTPEQIAVSLKTPPAPQVVPTVQKPQPSPLRPTPPSVSQGYAGQARNHPFVVEELEENV